MISLFTQIVILIVVLACMIMLLMAIRQLTHYEGFEDSEETSHLKEEVEEDTPIISSNNIFSNLVETDMKKNTKENNYKSNSNDPLSRRE